MAKRSRLLLALTFAFATAVGASSARPLSPSPRNQPPAIPMAPQPMLRLTSSALAGSHSVNQLYADSCASRSDCWAVGFYTNAAGAARGRALHFHRGKWSNASLPVPSSRQAGGYDYLDAVYCSSPSNCWAVGYYSNKSSASLNQALHWDGKKWRQVAIPQPAGTASPRDQNHLNGVTCASASDCWVVGAYTNGAGAYLNEALNWNGKRWALVTTPSSHGAHKGEQNVLYSVACISRTDCLSVGYGRNAAGQYVNEALQWSGTAWATAPTPRPGRTGTNGYAYLESLACPSASECWAAGGYHKTGRGDSNEIVKWDGTSWRRVTTPDPGSRGGVAGLTSVSCASSKSCWAVGYYQTRRGLEEALRWNGRRWSLATIPQPGHGEDASILRGVSCASPAKCWAVGYLLRSPGALLGQLLLEWNGKRWSVR